ncbi:MAG: M48 family peptidase, partial [Janthinobacterium sp.]
MAPISLKRYTVLASLCAFTALAPLSAYSQQPVLQDGIKVRPLSGTRIFAGGENFNEKSKLQYAELVREAKEKNALVPDSDPQVKRLRAIAQRIIPFATRWNEAAASWNWQVNLLNSDQVNAFCMPGGQIAFYSGIITKL